MGWHPYCLVHLGYVLSGSSGFIEYLDLSGSDLDEIMCDHKFTISNSIDQIQCYDMVCACAQRVSNNKSLELVLIVDYVRCSF